MIRQVTAADVEQLAARIEAESTAFFNETGKLRPITVSPGMLLKMLNEGDRMFIGEPDGAEGERIAVVAHREPGQGWYLTHVWAPSLRHRGILRWTAQKLNDLGFGNLMGHFPNIDTPICQLAKTVTQAATGDYRGSTWVASPAGTTCRIRLSTALNRIVAAGWPVEA